MNDAVLMGREHGVGGSLLQSYGLTLNEQISRVLSEKG